MDQAAKEAPDQSCPLNVAVLERRGPVDQLSMTSWCPEGLNSLHQPAKVRQGGLIRMPLLQGRVLWTSRQRRRHAARQPLQLTSPH